MSVKAYNPTAKSQRQVKKRPPPLKPLQPFNFGTVNRPLEGLLTNVDRDLQRMAKRALQSGHKDGERCLTLLNIMIRFASNSYNAVRYLCADTPEDPDRKPNYVLVVPNINRQLLDLLFSLVYMLDDFAKRSLEYQRAGWRELNEEYKQYYQRFSKDPEWADHFRRVRETLASTAQQFNITSQEQKKPQLIPYWPTPTQLKDKNTMSRKYLRYLTKWLYGDTSAQAHFSFGGVMKVAPFILAPLVGGQAQEEVDKRVIHQYRYQHFTRAALIALAIATEINQHFKLGNDERVSYLWAVFAEHSAEAKEMFEERYKTA
jgi:hypothetical protein